MVNRSRKDEIINLLLESIKNNNKFPYEIKTDRCLNHNEDCKMHHQEIVITSFNRATKKFHLKYYVMHEPGVGFEYDQPKEFVKGLILEFVNSRESPLLLRDLKKNIDPKLIMPRKKIIRYRLSDLELEYAKRISKQNGMSLSEFSRSRVLNVAQ